MNLTDVEVITWASFGKVPQGNVGGLHELSWRVGRCGALESGETMVSFGDGVARFLDVGSSSHSCQE